MLLLTHGSRGHPPTGFSLLPAPSKCHGILAVSLVRVAICRGRREGRIRQDVFWESAHNARHLAMLASVAMAVSCMRGQSWVKSSYGKRFPTVEGQEAHRLDHVRVVAFVIPDPRQSSCVWPRQNRYLRVSWDTRLRFLHTCWPTSVTAVLTLVPRPHACDQIFAAFQKTFYAHLQTLICGACFLRAAHAWPEEILRKAGPLKFRAVHHAFYGTGDAVAWCVSFLLAWSVSVAAS